MRKETIDIAGAKVDHLFDVNFREALKRYDASRVLLITDSHVAAKQNLHALPYRLFVAEPGEGHKVQQTITAILNEMLQTGYQRNAVVVGIGGGVVTDMAGFVASIYKRGVKLIQVPTSLLAMVDASIGGKNGINAGDYKNMIGTIYQPAEILFDYSVLQTLPEEEWINGFAEIIKHAAIQDAAMLNELEQHGIPYYKTNEVALRNLIEQNVKIKNNIVARDTTEHGDRRLLNFGHTFGHAIEKVYEIPHGQAVSIGMVMAAKISEEINDLYSADLARLKGLLAQYGLMTGYPYQKGKIWHAVSGDKKLEGSNMQFVVLNKPGEGSVMNIPMTQLFSLLEQIL